MKRGTGKRALSLFLSLLLVLSLLPGAVFAGGSQDWLEATFYDNNRPEDYGYGTNDGTLITDADGAIAFSVSAFRSVPANCTINGVWLVDASGLAERYNLLDPSYGGANESQIFESDGDYGLDVWIQNLTIPNAALGEYRLKVVAGGETYYSEAYSDEYHSTDGVVRVVDGSSYVAKPTITTSFLPSATVGTAYSATLEATPHTQGAAIVWSITDGALPDGLALSQDGVISGTPTAGGSFSFTAQAAETGGETATKRFTLFVSYPAPTITTTSLPEGRVGVAYAAQLTATPYLGGELTWSLNSDSDPLPDGLSLAADGTISGTPTAAGTYSFYPMVTETATGVGISRSFSIRIQEGVCTVNFRLNGGTGAVGESYESRTVQAEETVTLPAAPTMRGYVFRGWESGDAVYQPGDALIVENSLNLTAGWNALPPVTVTFPADLDPVVGLVYLYGTYLDGDSTWTTSLWGNYYAKATALPESIVLDRWYFLDRTFTELELFAYVGDREIAIARYEGGVTDETETVALTSTGIDYTVIDGVTVTGLTEYTDYRGDAVYCGDAWLSLPRLVDPDAHFTVRLNGIPSSDAYPLYDWEATYSATRNGTQLVVTPDAIGDPSVTLSGVVTMRDGAPLPNATVSFSQYYKGVNRIRTATTDADGSYSLALYPASGLFRVVSGGRSMGFDGTDWIDLRNGDVTRNIRVLTATLRVTADLQTSADSDAVARYLSALDKSATLTVSDGANVDSLTVYMRSDSYARDRDLYRTAALTGDLTCRLSAPWLEETTANATLTGGEASLRLTPVLKGGVVVTLASMTTGSYFLAWYDTSGAYAGRTSAFSLSSWARSYASVRPGAAGTYTIVLVPGVFEHQIAETTLGGLTADQRITSWSATVSADGVTELDAYTVSETASKNAYYVTQPASTLTASAESFATETDLITFSGSIGLDAGLSNGKLTSLTISNIAYDNTAVIQEIVIAGKRYPAQHTTGTGYYYYSFNEPIDLPCDYAIYCHPGSASWDMTVAVEAGVTYDGGSQYGALIGSAVVSRPGIYLETLSTFVCSDAVTVSGIASPGETVTLCDGDVVVGSATADRYGDWTALVPLCGIDESGRKLATSHRLTSVNSDGARSDELLIVHQADGPELTGFTMSWNGDRTIHIGDAYVYAGGMRDLTFTATFANPDKLSTMEAWGNKVVIKACLTNGVVAFYRAAETSAGVFTTDPVTLYTSVARAEVLYVPETPRSAYDSDLGYYVMTVSSAEAETFYSDILAEYNDANGLTGDDAMTAEKAKALLDGATSADNWSMTVGADGVTLSGAFADGDPDAAGLAETLEVLADAGVELRSVRQLAGDDTLNTMELLLEAGETADGTEQTMLYGSFRLYETAESLKVAEDYTASFAKKWIENTDENGHKTVTYLFNDFECSEDGKETTCTYDVTLRYAYGVGGVYAEQISAGFFKGFVCETGGTGDAVINGAGRTIRRPEPTIGTRSMGYSSSYTTSIQNNPGAWQAAYGKPATQTDANSTINVDAVGNTISNTSGDWGNAMSLGDNALTIANPSYSGPLGWLGAGGCWWGWWKQMNKYGEDLTRIWNENWDLGKTMFSPCFWKLDAEGKSAVVTRYIAWAYQNGKRELFDTFNYLQSTYINLFNTTVLILGAVGVLESGGISAGAAAWTTVGTTFINMGFNIMCTQEVEYVDQQRDTSYAQARMEMDSVIRAYAKTSDDDDCNGKDKKDGNGKSNRVGNDPSGIVYEGVIENPVEGATVTLYYAVDGSNDPVSEANASSMASLIPANNVRNLIPRVATQTTGADGRFQWGVPEGLWFVTAAYAGLNGNSNADAAATIAASGLTLGGQSVTNLLPVLPVQLDVNIPLIDATAPVVTDVRFTDEGVYVTFSKYMTEGSGAASVLDAANYALYDVSTGTAFTIASVTSAEQGHAPSNIDANETTYTRTVLLTTAETLAAGANVRLEVTGGLTSYAGTPIGADYVGFGTTATQTQLDAPTFSPASGEVALGTGVTISAADGTTVYYTVDGTDPTTSSTVYSAPIAVSNDTTIKAIAVKAGYRTSAVATGAYTVAVASTHTVSGAVTTSDGGSANGISLTLSGTSVNRTATISGGAYRFDSVPDGDYTIAFAGNAAYDPLSVSVTVADGSVTVNLTLEEHTTPEGPYVPAEPESTEAEPAEETEIPFVDVEKDAYYYDAVAWAVANDITEGTDDEHFAPEADASRAQVITFIWRAFGRPEPTITVSRFTDVDETAYYYKAVLWAEETGVTEGTSETTFSPDDPITRAETVTFLFRALGSKMSGTLPFRDVADETYYYDAVLWAAALGITEGTSETTFSPEDDCLRCQIVTFLYRAFVQ